MTKEDIIEIAGKRLIRLRTFAEDIGLHIRTVQLWAIGQGSAGLAQGRHPEAAEEEALRTGLSLGMTLIDTAEIYGDGRSEKLISRVIAGQRDRVFLVSKVWPNHVMGDGIARACDASLGRLGTRDLLDGNEFGVARAAVAHAGGVGFRRLTPTEGQGATPIRRPRTVIVTDDGFGFAVAKCDAVDGHNGIPPKGGCISIAVWSQVAAVVGSFDRPLLAVQHHHAEQA